MISWPEGSSRWEYKIFSERVNGRPNLKFMQPFLKMRMDVPFTDNLEIIFVLAIIDHSCFVKVAHGRGAGGGGAAKQTTRSSRAPAASTQQILNRAIINNWPSNGMSVL